MLKTWLQFVRLPAVFTAMADIFLGFLAMKEGFVPLGSFLLLLGSSSCLYLAGMIFNDVFDREADAETRPNRAIPAGKITVKTAATVGALLMIAGVACAAVVGLRSLAVAGGLVVLILAYDAGGKRTLAGPLLMGGCRFLNVCLGASVSDIFRSPIPLAIAAGLGIYIVGVTWFARTEDTGGNRTPLRIGLFVVNLGFLTIMGTMYLNRLHEMTQILFMIGLIFVVALSVNLRLTAAIAKPEPGLIQSAVRISLLSLITLDASCVLYLTGNPILCIVTALLFVPAVASGRVMAMT